MSQNVGMSDEDRTFCQQCAMKGNRIAERINRAGKHNVITEAAFLLHGRIVESCNSLEILVDKAPHNFSFDAAMILRGMYDAMLQCLYILADPDERENRARLFLDFFWVEQRRITELMDNNPSFVAQHVRTSPKRPSHEPQLQQKFDLVRTRYLNRKGTCRRTWYTGGLRKLARAVGYEHEYEILQQYLSAYVHSSAFALKWGGSGLTAAQLITNAWMLSLRTLGPIADVAGVALTDEETEAIRGGSESIVG